MKIAKILLIILTTINFFAAVAAEPDSLTRHSNRLAMTDSLFEMIDGLHAKAEDVEHLSELTKENFSFNLMSVGGPSAGNLLGRFTQGNEELLQLTKNVILQEEQDYKDIIFAEIVHLPQSRTGNVLLRPVLREYEIPYVGNSGASGNKQLLISDLYLCVRDDEVILISKKFNKRVIPRLTTAHNFHYGSLPIYKFLCDLQFQNISLGPIWDWGHLERLKYLPRVVYKNIIYKKARWTVELSELSDLPSLKDDYKIFFTEFNSKRKIPNRVLLIESDNQMLIDFDQQSSILMFLSYLKKYKTLYIEEFLFTNENCIVKNKQGRSHTNEIIIPVHNKNETSKLKTYNFNEDILDEKHHPGSEWLFFKVFCSAKTVDKVLVQYILPFVETCEANEAFDNFFFIRYKDPDSHLRIRFYNKDISKQQYILLNFTAILKPLLDNDIIQRITVDTYIPETERYGGPELLTISETLFDRDSLATLKILNLLESETEDNYRIFISMRSIDALLNDFSCSINDKVDLLKKISQGYALEFGSGPQLQKNLNAKYKDMSRSIFSFMDSEQDVKNDMLEVIAILNYRSDENSVWAKRSLEIIQNQENSTSLDTFPYIAHSYVG